MKRRSLAIALAAAISLVGAASAQATTITIGSVFPAGFAPQPFGQVATQFNTTLPEKGANISSPVDGTVVRWRVQGASGGPFFLRVLRPTGKGAYIASGTSNPSLPSGSGLQTFSANIPIESGDLIGIDPTNAGDTIGVAAVPGASFSYIFPPPFDGSQVAPSGSGTGQELELSAEVQPAPIVSHVEPRSGSIAGGETVTIEGENFSAASAVNFGTVAASSFTVGSDKKITATVPASTTAGAVDITVTTLAGVSKTSSKDRFTYVACVVPKLRGKRLPAARRALQSAHCRLGKVRGPRSGKVAKQKPRPGTVLVPGSKVSVKMRRAGH